MTHSFEMPVHLAIPGKSGATESLLVQGKVVVETDASSALQQGQNGGSMAARGHRRGAGAGVSAATTAVTELFAAIDFVDIPSTHYKQAGKGNGDNPRVIDDHLVTIRDDYAERSIVHGVFDKSPQALRVSKLINRTTVFHLDRDSLFTQRQHEVHFGIPRAFRQVGNFKTANGGQVRTGHTFRQMSRQIRKVGQLVEFFRNQGDYFLQPTRPQTMIGQTDLG